MPQLEASVIVPTRRRADYLRVALASLAAQDLDPASYEVIVVDDGPSDDTRAVTEQAAAGAGTALRYVERAGVPGLNSARNTGVAASEAPFVVFVDDDVEAPPGWLRELLDGRRRHPEAQVLGGPIELRLEGSRLPMCGRESPPITTLDAGPGDREIEVVWGANMGADRRAFELAGMFDEGVPYGFDEDMWERRLRERGGTVMYVGRAGLVHRRDARDSRLRPLMRAAYMRGRSLRRYVEHRGQAPSAARELRVLAGCVWHIFRRRCGNGLLLTAHSAGRVREMLAR
ncbi:MAG TPA: glycosyltransferase family 2 protein [Solirubrobacterales bacterium]|nr:glycosyltransferase family 2 protein [Solirubrobacterales bacterium]